MSNLNVRIDNPENQEVIVLLHGWMHSSERWYSLIDVLKPYYCVVSPDLPGFGMSQAYHGKLTLDFVSQEVASLIAQLKETKSIKGVVAHSTGGLIALKIALLMGDFSKSYFLFGIPIQKTFLLSTMSFFRWLIGFGHRLSKLMPNFIRYPIIKFFSLPTILYYGHTDDVLVRDVLKANTQIAMSLLADVAKGSDFISDIPQLSRSVVYRGTNDRIVSRKVGQTLANVLGTEFFEFPNSGHTPHLEVKDEFNNAVLNHLDF